MIEMIQAVTVESGKRKRAFVDLGNQQSQSKKNALDKAFNHFIKFLSVVELDSGTILDDNPELNYSTIQSNVFSTEIMGKFADFLFVEGLAFNTAKNYLSQVFSYLRKKFAKEIDTDKFDDHYTSNSKKLLNRFIGKCQSDQAELVKHHRPALFSEYLFNVETLYNEGKFEDLALHNLDFNCAGRVSEVTVDFYYFCNIFNIL